MAEVVGYTFLAILFGGTIAWGLWAIAKESRAETERRSADKAWAKADVRHVAIVDLVYNDPVVVGPWEPSHVTGKWGWRLSSKNFADGFAEKARHKGFDHEGVHFPPHMIRSITVKPNVELVGIKEIVKPSCDRCGSLNMKPFVTQGEAVLKYHCKDCLLVQSADKAVPMVVSEGPQ